MLSIPQTEIPSSADYQWVTVSVCGDTSLGKVKEHEANGWVAVPLMRHPALANKSVSKDRIEFGGLQLMERPRFVTNKAVEWERERAVQQVKTLRQVDMPRVRSASESAVLHSWWAWVWVRNTPAWKWLRRRVVLAAPSCRHWVFIPREDAWRCSFRRDWKITRLEYESAR